MRANWRVSALFRVRARTHKARTRRTLFLAPLTEHYPFVSIFNCPFVIWFDSIQIRFDLMCCPKAEEVRKNPCVSWLNCRHWPGQEYGKPQRTSKKSSHWSSRAVQTPTIVCWTAISACLPACLSWTALLRRNRSQQSLTSARERARALEALMLVKAFRLSVGHERLPASDLCVP